jgi:hypothetical protein
MWVLLLNITVGGVELTALISAAILLVAFILFLFWYYPIPRPLRKEEVERYMDLMPGARVSSGDILDLIREFASSDNGKEFFMVNMEIMYEKPQYKQASDQEDSSEQANVRYVRNMMPMMLARASHPYCIFKPFGYLSAISKQEDNLWHSVSSVRYRSRRDFLNIVTTQRWRSGYAHKVAALKENSNMPSRAMLAMPVVPLLVFTLLLAVQLIVMACVIR